MGTSLATLDRPTDPRGSILCPRLPIEPMLAHTFRGKLPNETLFSQPKLDGVRCLATSGGLWTRTGNRITSCAHIEAALRPLFERQPDLILDGELYSHGLRDDLPAIISLVNTRRHDPTSRARCEELIGFHVFDLPSYTGSFSARHGELTTLVARDNGNGKPLSLVDTTQVRDQAHLDDLFTSYLAAGYEGQMIRQDAQYEQTRSTGLLKRKPFEDTEFEVVRLIEVGGTHAGYAKRVVLRLPDGRTFMAGIKGSRQYARSLLGQEFASATVRYAALGQSGIPRSPVTISLHREITRF